MNSIGARGWRWWAITGALAGLSMAIGWPGCIHPVGGPHDSLRYLGMAENLLQGVWLGPYNHMTLIRQPGYPLMVALSGLLAWPLHVFQQGLYVGSALLLALALRRWQIPAWRGHLFFGLCVLHPFAFWPATFVATEALYTPAAVAVLAGLLGTVGAWRDRGVRFYPWLLLFSGAAAVVWNTRPERAWLLPLSLAGAVWLIWSIRTHRPRNWGRIPVALILPPLVIAGATGTLAALNQRHYGVNVTYELEEPNFKAAFHWLTRLEPQSHQPYVPVTRAALTAGYQVSPHLARLSPFLADDFDGSGWSQYGCQWMGICDELAGGWAVWALREAAAAAGYHTNAHQASEFYGDVSSELRDACRRKALLCSPNPTGNLIAPPLTPRDFSRLLVSFGRATRMLLTFDRLPDDLEASLDARPDPGLAARYRAVTHDGVVNRAVYMRSADLIRIHFGVYTFLQVLGGLLIAAALAGAILAPWLKAGRIPDRLRLKPADLFPFVAAVTFVLSYLTIVAYVDAMSFKAQMRYLLALYPALVLLACLSLPAVVRTAPGRSAGDA